MGAPFSPHCEPVPVIGSLPRHCAFRQSLRLSPVIASEAWQSSFFAHSGAKALSERHCWIATSQAPRNDDLVVMTRVPVIGSFPRHCSFPTSLRAKRGNPVPARVGSHPNELDIKAIC